MHLGGCTNLIYIEIPTSVQTIGSMAFMECKNLKEIIIPSNIPNRGNFIFDGCENIERSIVIGKKGDYVNWLEGEIIYLDPDYYEFAKEYITEKSQEEIEELVLKTAHFLGTFEELIEQSMIDQMAEEYRMTRNEFLKYILKTDESSWVKVEYGVLKNNAEGKTLEELRKMFAQKMGGTDSFEELLKQAGITMEDFKNMIVEEGFRSEEDYLKAYIFMY